MIVHLNIGHLKIFAQYIQRDDIVFRCVLHYDIIIYNHNVVLYKCILHVYQERCNTDCGVLYYSARAAVD